MAGRNQQALARPRPGRAPASYRGTIDTPATPLDTAAPCPQKAAPKPCASPTQLDGVCYDLRGPLLQTAIAMEEEGHHILKLNIGNPGAFGLDAPDEILRDVIANLWQAQPYSESRGLFPARKAIMQHCQRQGVPPVDVDDIFLGNGASELIQLAVQALLNPGDELLIPCPDYPLWSAVTRLANGVPTLYRCVEEDGWQPDLEQLRAQISPRSRGIVVINPNNPTGAVYSQQTLAGIVALAREHGLVLFADEIYEKTLYEDARHVPLAKLSGELCCITFSGLSKNYRLAGFRSGWMIISGDRRLSHDYREGIALLTSMRLCANVPGQLAVQTALGGHQSIEGLVAPGGRLREQRDHAWRRLNAMPGVSCHKPGGAIYLFPRLDPEHFGVQDDEQLALELLRRDKLLLTPGSAFNWPQPDHLRLTFLPTVEVMEQAMDRLADFLSQRVG